MHCFVFVFVTQPQHHLNFLPAALKPKMEQPPFKVTHPPLNLRPSRPSAIRYVVCMLYVIHFFPIQNPPLYVPLPLPLQLQLNTSVSVFTAHRTHTAISIIGRRNIKTQTNGLGILFISLVYWYLSCVLVDQDPQYIYCLILCYSSVMATHYDISYRLRL